MIASVLRLGAQPLIVCDLVLPQATTQRQYRAHGARAQHTCNVPDSRWRDLERRETNGAIAPGRSLRSIEPMVRPCGPRFLGRQARRSGATSAVVRRA